MSAPEQAPLGRYESVFAAWSRDAVKRQVGAIEITTIAAQFLGLVVAKLELDPSHQQEMLDKLFRIAATACVSKSMVREGLAISKVPGTDYSFRDGRSGGKR